MTRKKALEMTRWDYNVSCETQSRSIINEIYDAFENRTCENCKYCELAEDDEYTCFNEYMNEKFNAYPQYDLCIEKDFECNKFKRIRR